MIRRFTRPQGCRPYKKLFVVAVEGDKTEPNYFASLKRISNNVSNIKVIPSNKASAPNHVLKNLKKYLKAHQDCLRDSDETWVVVDADAWTQEQLQELYRWESEADHRGVAVSNPKFELWILLHFEDGQQISRSNCDERLRKYIKNYHKSGKFVFSEEQLKGAVERAKSKDKPPCAGCPREGVSTVYRLVERILGSG